MRGLKGKAGIVTGGGSGIGEAIAKRLGAEGARVHIFDRNLDGARRVMEEVQRQGGTAHAHGVDIVEGDAVDAAVNSVELPSFLVNAAGWDAPKPFLETDRSSWKRIVDINLYGTLNMLHAVCRKMKDAGGGAVVNVASDSARVGASDVSIYTACKGGMIALTKSLARELAPVIRLNVISPGPTETPLLASFAGEGPHAAKWLASVSRSIPLKRLGVPEDFSGLAAFLLSDEASYITGQTISVSGGLTMV